MDASLICVLCERQWRREYGEHSPIQAQACLNGPVAALVKSGPRKGSRGTDASVHFFSSPSLKRGVSAKGVFDESKRQEVKSWTFSSHPYYLLEQT
jgi:hypothetical protein